MIAFLKWLIELNMGFAAVCFVLFLIFVGMVGSWIIRLIETLKATKHPEVPDKIEGNMASFTRRVQ